MWSWYSEGDIVGGIMGQWKTKWTPQYYNRVCVARYVQQWVLAYIAGRALQFADPNAVALLLRLQKRTPNPR